VHAIHSVCLCVCWWPYIFNISYVCNDFLRLSSSAVHRASHIHPHPHPQSLDASLRIILSPKWGSWWRRIVLVCRLLHSPFPLPSPNVVCLFASCHCLFVTAWPNASTTPRRIYSMPYSIYHLTSSWEFRSGPCVFHCWRLPVPVDLRAMLTAICMEHGPRFAWLDGPRTSKHSVGDTGIPDSRRRPCARPFKKDPAHGFNAILIRPRPRSSTNSQISNKLTIDSAHKLCKSQNFCPLFCQGV